MTRTMSMTGRRQDCILECLAENGPASRELIAQWLAGHGCHCSKATIVRDLQALAAAGLVESAGQGRAVRYAQAGAAGTPGKDFPVDTDAYFAEGPDSRELASETFNFDLLCQDPRLLTDEERAEADRCNERYRKSRAEMSECLLQKEYQRLVIELAWKSSKIEGCTYNLPEVEHLLREHVPSPARTRRETRIVLNHQKAMDYILEQPSHYRTLNHTKVEEIHSLLVSGLNVPKGVRHRTVCIGGTRYRPLDNFFQLEEALRGITDMINRTEHPMEKALLASLMIAYLQPFEDGNKRTSRLVANAVLLAHDWCPLSYRSMDIDAYRRAVLLFYEQNSISCFKQILLEQFRFAVGNSF